MNERDAQRRTMIEQAFRTPGVSGVSNNEIHRRFHANIGIVRELRRRLEASGDIPVVLHRISRHGRPVDVTRVLNSRGFQKAPKINLG